MSNRDPVHARRYHDATKHSYLSVRADPHALDWRNQPLPFKIYTGLDPIPLPRQLSSTSVSTLRAIAERVTDEAPAAPDLPQLAYLLYQAAGITKTRRYPGGEMAFRAASCTGALYEIELYVVCRSLGGLEAGVYHFGPHDFALRCLRSGDYRAVVAEATAGATGLAPVVIVCSGTYWRNAWKYRARTYRHFGWDNGTLLANLLAACRAQRLPARVVCGFVDRAVNELVGLDTFREVAFSIVAVGRDAAPAVAAPPVPPLALETMPLSPEEVDYPIMREVHAASALETPDEVAAWRQEAEALRLELDAARGARTFETPATFDLPVPEDALTADPVEEVVRRRGSTRQFDRGASWSLQQLSVALVQATRGLDADFLGEASRRPEARDPLLNELYVIAHAVDGLPAGAYVLRRAPWRLDLLKAGSFRHEAGYLGLEQDLPADASAVVFFLADLDAILTRLGNRGYRAVQLEAGILGGKLYLAAYAQRLGASGLTFYDDDVVEFFSPHARGMSTVFCMTLGRARRRGS